MVAVCGKKTVAIECDGERYHSGEAKVREDMERQTILERLGWRFIRIRGSEYFRNPEKAIERVVSELSTYGIAPEASEVVPENTGSNFELLERVKSCAARILLDTQGENAVDIDTIAAALDPKSIVPEHVSRPDITPKPVKVSLGEVKTIQETPKTPKESESSPQVTIKDEVKIRSKEKSIPAQVQKQPKQTSPKQQVIPGMESAMSSVDDVIALLKRKSIPYVDKRSKNGALWILGGKELAETVKECRNLGVKFIYKEDGGKATKGKPGWWAK